MYMYMYIALQVHYMFIYVFSFHLHISCSFHKEVLQEMKLSPGAARSTESRQINLQHTAGTRESLVGWSLPSSSKGPGRAGRDSENGMFRAFFSLGNNRSNFQIFPEIRLSYSSLLCKLEVHEVQVCGGDPTTNQHPQQDAAVDRCPFVYTLAPRVCYGPETARYLT